MNNMISYTEAKNIKMKIIPVPLDSYKTGSGFLFKEGLISLHSCDNFIIIKHEYIHKIVNPIVLNNKSYCNKFSPSFDYAKTFDSIKTGYNDLNTFIYECIVRAVDHCVDDMDNTFKNMVKRTNDVGNRSNSEIVEMTIKNDYKKGFVLVPYFCNYFRENRKSMNFKTMVINAMKDYNGEYIVENGSTIDIHSLNTPEKIS